MPSHIERHYEQDLIEPVALRHGFDFGDKRPDGSFGFAYNFIDYHFEDGAEEVMARHYLDDPGRVDVRRGVALLGTEFGQKVLMFLALRFDEVRVLGEEGYEPLAEGLAAQVRERLHAHMQTFD